MSAPGGGAYSPAFFDVQAAGILASARIVLAALFARAPVASAA